MKSAYNINTLLFVGNYPINELPENCEFASENYQLQFIVGKWNGTEWVEGATPEENAEQTISQRKENEKQMYIKRTNDGIDAYAEISAEFRLAKLSGQITEEAHAHIERTLIPVRNEVLAGQWISGLKELELIGIDAIGQQLYDRLHLQISNYITENYNDVLE